MEDNKERGFPEGENTEVIPEVKTEIPETTEIVKEDATVIIISDDAGGEETGMDTGDEIPPGADNGDSMETPGEDNSCNCTCIHCSECVGKEMEDYESYGNESPSLTSHETLGSGLSPAYQLPNDITASSDFKERDFSRDDRKRMAKSGEALPDGSYPIANSQDLENAVMAIGRAKNPALAKTHIKNRARALGLTSKLPDSWKEAHEMEGVVKGYTDAGKKVTVHSMKMSEEYALVESEEGEILLNENLKFAAKVLEHYEGNKWKVAIIKEGWSLNNRYYPREVLVRDQGKFEGAKIAMYGFAPDDKKLNHVSSAIRRSVPGGDLFLNEVGWVENVRTENDPIDGKLTLVGDFQCIDENLARKLINIKNVNPNHLPGFSIDAIGDVAMGVAEGKKGLVVNSISHGYEVTLVGQPAAGGKFLRLVASLAEEEEVNPKGEYEMDENNVNKVADAVAEKLSALEAKLAEAERKSELAECKALLNERLKESGLNVKAVEMIKKQFDGKMFGEDELEKAIVNIRELLASAVPAVTLSQPRISVGANTKDKLEAMMALAFGYNPERDTKLSEADKEVYRNVRPSLRKAYELWMDDPDLEFPTMPGPCSIQEATSSDLSVSLANTMNRALFQKYADLPQYWRPFVTVNPNVKDFRTQTRILWNGFGGMFSISESDSTDVYLNANLGFPGEDSITYSLSEFGGTVPITRKMVINDDLQMLADIPLKLARMANKDVTQFVFNLLMGNKGGAGINTDNAYDGTHIYHANHFNTTTAALSHTSLNAAIVALGSQMEYGMKTTVTDNPLTNVATTINLGTTKGLATGQYIVIEAEKILVGTVASGTQLTGCTRGVLGTTGAQHAQTTVTYQLAAPLNLMRYHLLYPQDLQDTVTRVLGNQERQGVSGTLNNDLNRFVGLVNDKTITPVSLPNYYLGGDTNNWYLLALPEEISSVEVAFLNNKQMPEMFVQSDPTVGNVFNRDVTTYKMRYDYGGIQLDWRGYYGGIVA